MTHLLQGELKTWFEQAQESHSRVYNDKEDIEESKSKQLVWTHEQS